MSVHVCVCWWSSSILCFLPVIPCEACALQSHYHWFSCWTAGWSHCRPGNFSSSSSSSASSSCPFRNVCNGLFFLCSFINRWDGIRAPLCWQNLKMRNVWKQKMITSFPQWKRTNSSLLCAHTHSLTHLCVVAFTYTADLAALISAEDIWTFREESSTASSNQKSSFVLR